MKNQILKPDSRLKRKVIRVVMAGSLVMVSAVIGFNCSGFKVAGSDGDGSFSSSSVDNSIPVGFLSSEQILKSMISVSGIESLGEVTTADDAAIDAAYQQRTGSLPSVQDLSAATGPTLIAITNLASTVCNKAVNNDIATSQASNRLFFTGIDFSKGLSAQSSSAFVDGFSRLARNAWRRDVTAAESNQIDTFIQDFVTDANVAMPEDTRLLAVSICTAVLSSTDALTY